MGLDYEIHFFARRRAPVAEFRSTNLAVAPRQQIAEDQVLEIGPVRLNTRQVQRQSGIAPVGLWRLDEPLRPVDGMGR